ncbi:hypothetical protein D5086_032381 [Populus alba]|uniref:Uncharacterized protein n=1 Tax=Populus alba TaxID=43335 RepID=A0ACC4ALA5_POPAL
MTMSVIHTMIINPMTVKNICEKILLMDANGILKVSDFGLSALPQQVREDGLLHTTCGTPNHVAPEVCSFSCNQ